MMGRGLVHPVDLHHDDNPPSHPELLDLLATQFVAMKYDIKAFLRELALTRAYQREQRAAARTPPDELAEPRHFAVAAAAADLARATGLERDAGRRLLAAATAPRSSGSSTGPTRG